MTRYFVASSGIRLQQGESLRGGARLHTALARQQEEGDSDRGPGAYSITKLPLAAPQYAAYSATLPLSFAPALTTPTTGMYKVDASATGYTTLAIPSVDITVANATNVNFALVP